MNQYTWIFFIFSCVSFILFVAAITAAIRLAARVTELERRLKTSRQAHGLDVAAFTKKMYEQSKVLSNLRQSSHE